MGMYVIPSALPPPRPMVVLGRCDYHNKTEGNFLRKMYVCMVKSGHQQACLVETEKLKFASLMDPFFLLLYSTRHILCLAN